MQKSRFYFVAYGLLALMAGLIVLASCGKGTVEPIAEEWDAKEEVSGGIIKQCYENGSDICDKIFSNGSGTTSSSGEEESSSSEDDNYSSEDDNYSSEEESSSSNEEESSSSTGPTHTLWCSGLNDVPKGTSVTKPTVKCGDDVLNSGVTFTWKKEKPDGETVPDNFSGNSAGYFYVFAKADCGGEIQEKMCGDIDISDGKSSSSVTRSSSSRATNGELSCVLAAVVGTVGTAVDLPIVRCDGTNITSGLTWKGVSSSWFDNPDEGTKTVSVEATCGGSKKTAECGDIRINSRPSSNSGGGTSSPSGGDCSRSGWCDYGPGNCYQMPTDDCCESGKIVASQSACSAGTAKYCNYGVCEGGSGWSCSKGGCWQKSESECTSDGGTVVACCPTNTRPPSANYPACN